MTTPMPLMQDLLRAALEASAVLPLHVLALADYMFPERREACPLV
jgi:hypothetical protein